MNNEWHVRDANAVWNTGKTRFRVGLPVQYHCSAVSCDEDSPVGQVRHNREVITVEGITKELTGNSYTIEA